MKKHLRMLGVSNLLKIITNLLINDVIQIRFMKGSSSHFYRVLCYSQYCVKTLHDLILGCWAFLICL